ncbi:MAG: AraC family transcriptional regulator [Coriobacteriia bacterium]|nr:AraC family transcriptional regulator [Coriobacteriia bacterium]MCL2745749.1 AraC family transcriptional regulator [Coriobacteriia bacterium]MCL2870538.1 AraC family transcriptional regulator [Coriobacteriia bacterium]
MSLIKTERAATRQTVKAKEKETGKDAGKFEWHRQVQRVVDDIDRCIENRDDDGLALKTLAQKGGYSEYHMSRSFKKLAGISLRDYLRGRRLAFALIDIRDTDKSILDIATSYGFSSHEAFSRSFKMTYGMPPSEYRTTPRPVVLRTKLNTFDRYLLGLGEIGMVTATKEIKIYFTSIEAHKFLHLKDYESKGYFDFWQRQAKVPGRDCDTICELLDETQDKLDATEVGSSEYNGHIMAHIYEGDKKAEAYGVRLPIDYVGEVPPQMTLIDVPKAEYLVFEHGSFDFEEECESVGERLQAAIDGFDYGATDYTLDTSSGRVQYFMFDPSQFEKRILPVKRS